MDIVEQFTAVSVKLLLQNKKTYISKEALCDFIMESIHHVSNVTNIKFPTYSINEIGSRLNDSPYLVLFSENIYSFVNLNCNRLLSHREFEILRKKDYFSSLINLRSDLLVKTKFGKNTITENSFQILLYDIISTNQDLLAIIGLSGFFTKNVKESRYYPLNKKVEFKKAISSFNLISSNPENEKDPIEKEKLKAISKTFVVLADETKDRLEF